ncbi:MAG: hypothetical protein HQK75_20280, partial [Candidatus Magnetomorum sp.]|nr:hypothetical protein [Candidatus Magnetomorum sp.]
ETVADGRYIFMSARPSGCFTLSGNGSIVGDDSAKDSGHQNFITPTVKMSSLNVPDSTSVQVSSDHILYCIQLDTTGLDVSLKQLDVKTNGSYDISEIKLFKLRFSGDDQLSEGDPILDEQAAVASGQTISFSDFEQLFQVDHTGYLFITVDLNDQLLPKRTIGIDSIPINQFTYTKKPDLLGSDVLPEGNQHTLYISPTIDVSMVSVPSSNVAQGIKAHLIYQTKLSVSKNNAILTDIAFMTGGSFEKGDIDQFTLWVSDDNILDAGDTKLQSQRSPSSGNSVVFSELSYDMLINTKHYLMVTIDVSDNAQGGNSIYIDTSPLKNIQLTDLNPSFTGALSKGNIYKFPYSPYVTTAVGFYHTVALRKNGMVWTWGRNHSGQLGNGTTDDSFMAVSLPEMKNVKDVAAGHHFSLAMTSEGTVWAWGENESGQLGNGTFDSQYTPQQVIGLMNVTDICAGASHSLALKNDGTVWAWGGNRYGQLGDGTFTDSHTPVRVTGLTNIVSIASGANFNMALTDDGSVWTWGQNDFGQLANGNRTNQSTASQVSNLNNVTAIAAGETHALVMLSDKTVKAWGANEDGRLGNNSTSDSLTPVQVSGLANIIDIAAGNRHSLALDDNNQVWSWGWNGHGQLGNGDTTEQHTPLQITSLPAAVDVEAGGDYSVVRLVDGTLRSWGHNQYGQLGDGTSENRLTPVQGGVIPIISISSANAGPDVLQRGGTNQLLYRIDLLVSDANATLNGLDLVTSGDYDITDLGDGFQLWYSTDEVFNLSTALLLANNSSVPVGDSINLNNYSQKIGKNTTAYLFITVNVSSDAIGGRIIQLVETPFANIHFEETNCLKTGESEPVSASHEKRFPTVEVTINAPDIPDKTLSQGNQRVILYQLNMMLDKGDGHLSELRFTPAGTYQTSDLVPFSFKLHYSTDSVLDTNDPVLSVHDIVQAGESLVFDKLNLSIAGNTTVYLFLTVDISSLAGGNRFVSIMETKFDTIQFEEVYVYKNGIDPMPNSGIQTFKMSTVTLSSPSVQASQVAQGTTNHVLYQLDMAVADADIFMYSLTFNPEGTYQMIDIDQFRLYYSLDTTLSLSDDILMASFPSVSSGSTILFTQLSFLLKAGQTGHFFVTADINEKAIARTIYMNDFQLSDITFSDTVKRLPETSSLSVGGVQTFPTPQVAISAVNVPASDVEQDTQNHLIYGFKLTVSNADVYVDQLTVTTNGTYILSDLTAFNLKFSTDNVLNDTDESIATAPLIDPNFDLVFEANSKKIGQGTSAYLFITADIGAANGGRTLYIKGKTLNDIVFDSNDLIARTGVDTFPAGGVQTLPRPTINIASISVPDTTVEQDTENVILYHLSASVLRADATLIGFCATTAGNYIEKDLVSGSFRLKYSTDDTLDDSDITLQSLPFVPSGSELIFTINEQLFPKNTTGHLFVTVDIASGNGARTIQLTEISLDKISFVYAKKNSSGPILAGAKYTFPIPDITVTGPVVAEKEVPQNTSNHVIYRMNISPTRAEAYLTGLTLDTDGTYRESDLMANSFKLRISDDSSLNSTDDTLAASAYIASGGQLLF